MVETISPVVHGGRGKWSVALGLHALGATAAAAAFGALLGWLGGALGAPFGAAGLAAVAGLAVVYAIGELPRVSVPIPQLKRQVPDWWRTFFSWPVTAFLYGAGLGVGFFTFLAHGTLVVVAAAALDSGRPLLGALLMAPFGFARGISAVAANDVVTAEAGRRLVDRLAGTPGARRAWANGAAMIAIAIMAAVGAAHANDGWASLASAVVAGAFAWAAAAKWTVPGRWRAALEAYELPPSVTRVAAVAVPISEAAVPFLTLIGAPGFAAAWALVLLVGFTGVLVRSLIRGRRAMPCGCFGATSPRSVTVLLVRNGALAAAASLAAAWAPSDASFAWPGAPGPGELLPAALAAIAVLVAIVVAWQALVWLRGD